MYMLNLPYAKIFFFFFLVCVCVCVFLFQFKHLTCNFTGICSKTYRTTDVLKA